MQIHKDTSFRILACYKDILDAGFKKSKELVEVATIPSTQILSRNEIYHR